jgi:hypothetical protein
MGKDQRLFTASRNADIVAGEHGHGLTCNHDMFAQGDIPASVGPNAQT